MECLSPKGTFMLPQPHHQGLGTIKEAEVEIALTRSWESGDCSEIVCGHAEGGALMNSLKLLLPAQVPHKIEPVDISSGKREQLLSSRPSLKDY